MIELLQTVTEAASAIASLLTAFMAAARVIARLLELSREGRRLGRHKKPKTPSQIAADLEAVRLKAARQREADRLAAKDPEQWGADPRALRSQPDVQVIMENKTKVQTAKRTDVFDRVLTTHDKDEAEVERMRAALAAVRRLESDFAERAGRTGGSTGVRVDQGRPIPISDRSLMAADRIDAALRLVGLRDAALLRELIEPRQVLTSDEGERWRQVVVMFTGETHRSGQATAVRAACDNLALAYRDLDHAPKRAA